MRQSTNNNMIFMPMNNDMINEIDESNGLDKEVRNQELEELLNELDNDKTITNTASPLMEQKYGKSKTGISFGNSNNASPVRGGNLESLKV